jgi:uncharacterized membrane protein YqjE
MSTTPTQTPGIPPGQDPTLGRLVHDLTQQVPELIRSEMRLAQAELTEKGKRAGIGIGMFSVAGLLAFFAIGCLATTAILALAHALPDWLSALVVALALLAAAAVSGLMGKKKVAAATPPTPERAVEGLKEDVATIKGGHA